MLLTSDSLADLEQCESISKHVGGLWMPQRSPPWRGGPSACGGLCGSLIKTPQRRRCPCGGFPAISHGQTVDWTWPWKIKALHMWWVALLAPWGQGLQQEFQLIPGIGFSYVLGIQLAVANAVAGYKSKGQHYLPRKYSEDGLDIEYEARDPEGWSVGRERISQDSAVTLSRPRFCK